MKGRGLLAGLLFAGAVAAGTFLDWATHPPARATRLHVLSADLHVHPYPGDGSLTVWQLQREARRRGVDVIALTGHNNQRGLALSRLLGGTSDDVIVLPGQEVTAPTFHMMALGIERLIDWRLDAAAAVRAVQLQGGVAIAAHPTSAFQSGWTDEALAALDGAEVAHPTSLRSRRREADLRKFFDRLTALNPAAAAIGATDFHMLAPLGKGRTYLLAADRSTGAVIEALRAGRAVAGFDSGRLFGPAEYVAVVREHLAAAPEPAGPSTVEKGAAAVALLALVFAAWPRPAG